MKRKKVGLALGSGSVRGMAHIGALKVLEENRIPIDYISGTSAGALVGALYASGMSIGEIEDLVKTIKWEKLLDFSHPQSGLVRGKNIEVFLRKLIKNKSFDDLKIPFACVAVDIKTGEKIIFDEGNVAKAVRASISIPAFFEPVKMGRMLLVDGGVLDPVPVDILKKKVDFTIALDITREPSQYQRARSKVDEAHEFWKIEMLSKSVIAFRKYLKGSYLIPRSLLYFLKPKRIKKFLTGSYVPPAFKVLSESFNLIYSEMSRLRLKISKPDIIIQPDLSQVGMFDMDRINYCIQAGENATRKAIPEIKRKLGVK